VSSARGAPEALPIPELDRTLAALADNTRRSVVDLLVHKPRRAGELAQALAMTPAAMSRHLRVLRTSGLVEEDHQGDDARVRVYRLKRERFEALRSWLDEVESFWSGELEAFKAHAEKTRGQKLAKPATPAKAKR
jgi:DNA-binding transcriptional ArsR family regulator